MHIHYLYLMSCIRHTDEFSHLPSLFALWFTDAMCSSIYTLVLTSDLNSRPAYHHTFALILIDLQQSLEKQAARFYEEHGGDPDGDQDAEADPDTGMEYEDGE